MTERKDFPEFRFHGKAVGTFTPEIEPKQPGRYTYRKYRSMGHMDMAQQLNAGRPAQCEYTMNSRRVEFTVKSEPENGVLELDAVKESAL